MDYKTILYIQILVQSNKESREGEEEKKYLKAGFKARNHLCGTLVKTYREKRPDCRKKAGRPGA